MTFRAELAGLGCVLGSAVVITRSDSERLGDASEARGVWQVLFVGLAHSVRDYARKPPERKRGDLACSIARSII